MHKKWRIAHMADVHLGFSSLSATTHDGVNLRENDFSEAWERAVNECINRAVDIVVIAGDMFDTIRPTIRAIISAIEGIEKLLARDIIVLIIGGNHDTPRMRVSRHILEVLDMRSGSIDVAVKPQKGVLSISVSDKVGSNGPVFHLVPYSHKRDEMEGLIRSVHPVPGHQNVLVAHVGILDIPDLSHDAMAFSSEEITEMTAGMSYVALGHYHRRLEVAPHIVYPGSLERISFDKDEAKEEKGFYIIDINGDSISKSWVPIQTRPMMVLSLDSKEIEDDPAAGIIDYITSVVPDDIKTKYPLVRVSIENAPFDVMRAVNIHKLRSLVPWGYVDVRVTRLQEPETRSDPVEIAPLDIEWQLYMSSIDGIDLETRNRVSELGKMYIDRFEPEEEDQ